MSIVDTWMLTDGTNVIPKQHYQSSQVSCVVMVSFFFVCSPVLTIALVQLSG